MTIFSKCKYVPLSIFLLSLCLFTTQCINIKNIPDKELLKAPDNFGYKITDTLNSGYFSTRDFFKDSLLERLIQEGLYNNLNLQATWHNIEIARNNVQIKTGQMFPTVHANVSGAMRRYGLYTMDGAGNISTYIQPNKIVPQNLPDYYAGLTSSWEADIFGKLKNRKLAAQHRFLSTVEGKNFVQTNLIAEIATNYYELVALDHQIEIIDTSILLQQQALELVKIQKEAARSDELAVHQFEIQLLNMQGAKATLKQNIILLENNLNILLSRYPQPIQRKQFAGPFVYLNDVHTGIPSQLLQNRPDIRQAELELKAMKFDVKATKAAFYPSLTINAAAGLQAFQPKLLIDPQSIAYGLIGGLLTPVFNRSLLKAEFKTATSIQQQALINYQKIILNSFYEVYNELKSLENLDQMIELKKREIKSGQEAIEIANLLYKTNRTNYLDILIVQQRLLDARINGNQIVKARLLSMVNLYKALGGGWR